MNRLFFTRQANEDLIEIHDYIAGENPAAALRLVNRIEKRCKDLRIHPMTGRRRDDLAPGLRSLVQGRYVIFYRVVGRQVQIIRILHGARDIGRILKRP